MSSKLLADINITLLPTPNIGFKAPNFTDLLTFGIRLAFVAAGILALYYLVTGAISWITSNGEKENVDKARKKIEAAVIGLVLVFVVFGIAALLETVLKIGLGITAPIALPTLVQ